MRLTVVGCAGSYPSAESPASSYLVEAPYDGGTFRLVVDLGNGAFGALQRYVEPDAVDAVVISHLHPDHYMDVCGMYVYRKYAPGGALPALPLWAPVGAAERFALAYDLPPEPGMSQEYAISAWVDREPVTVGPFTITPYQVVHPVQAWALRIEADDAVLAYSGDTGPSDALVEAARGADLFLCEASFTEQPDNPPELHLTGTEAGEAATAAGVGRLLLTHVPTWTDRTVVADEASKAFAGPSVLVRPGDVYEI